MLERTSEEPVFHSALLITFLRVHLKLPNSVWHRITNFKKNNVSLNFQEEGRLQLGS